MFTRLFYFGVVQLRMTPEEFWTQPLGWFLDLLACHKQWHGLEKPMQDDTDEVLRLFKK